MTDIKVLVAERIRCARKDLNYTQEQIANALKVPYNTYREWEYGRNLPSLYTLQDLSELTGHPIMWFVSLEEDTETVLATALVKAERSAHELETLWKDIKSMTADLQGLTVPEPLQMVTLPYIGGLPADHLVEELVEITETMQVPAQFAIGADAVARIDGDCMEPRLKNGDFITLRFTNHADAGQVVVARTHEGKVTLKRLKFIGGALMLVPDNPSYPPVPAIECEIKAVVVQAIISEV